VTSIPPEGGLLGWEFGTQLIIRNYSVIPVVVFLFSEKMGKVPLTASVLSDVQM
jgi:hypothetical protein